MFRFFERAKVAVMNAVNETEKTGRNALLQAEIDKLKEQVLFADREKKRILCVLTAFLGN